MKKEEVRGVINGSGSIERVPNLCPLWVFPDLCGSREEEIQVWKDNHNCDIDYTFLKTPDLYDAPDDDKSYVWCIKGQTKDEHAAIDSTQIIAEWEDVEEFYESFPSPDYPGLIPMVRTESDDHYLLAGWWYCFFERHWSLRGMENALVDFLIYPDEVHRLYRHLTDFYLHMIDRIHYELKADGIFVSDDIGTQNGPMFSLEVFREFFKPCYAELIERAHSYGMHLWLHSCGDISLFMDDFIEIGLDVIHPIQKFAMDQNSISEKFGNKICLLAGIDVQQAVPFGTTDQVKEEVDRIYSAFHRPGNRFMITMGNASTPDWKVENLNAIYEELDHLNVDNK